MANKIESIIKKIEVAKIAQMERSDWLDFRPTRSWSLPTSLGGIRATKKGKKGEEGGRRGEKKKEKRAKRA